GPSSVLSHRSAAVIWRLTECRTPIPDVTVVSRGRKRRDGIDLHHAIRLYTCDVRVRDGIPITAPARTLIDFAAYAEDDELERAISEARVQRLITDSELRAALDRAGTRAGVARMRARLNREDDSGYTRS